MPTSAGIGKATLPIPAVTLVYSSRASGCARRGRKPREIPHLWRAGPGQAGAWSPCRRCRCPRKGPSRLVRTWVRRARSGRVCLPGRPSQGDRAGLVETRSLYEGVQDFFGDGLVHRDGHRRAGTGLTASDGHVADVDTVLPEDTAELPDHAGPVLVADEEHVLLGNHVEVEAHRFDEPRLHPWPEERPANGRLTHAHLHEVRVVRALRSPRCLDLEPPLLRERWRVDEVQGLEDHRREESFLGRDVEEARVEAGDLATILDTQGITGMVRKLVEQTSQRLAQPRELGHELGALPHRYWGVYGVYRHGAPEGRRHLLGSRDARPILGLRGARPEVRRYHDVGEREDRRVRRRLLGEYVERGTGDCALL